MKINLLVVTLGVVLLSACNNGQNTNLTHEIPEPESAGGKIFESFCADCHAPPRIKSHKPKEWRNIVERMQNHRLKKAYHLLNEEEKEVLLTYLKKHAE